MNNGSLRFGEIISLFVTPRVLSGNYFVLAAEHVTDGQNARASFAHGRHAFTEDSEQSLMVQSQTKPVLCRKFG